MKTPICTYFAMGGLAVLASFAWAFGSGVDGPTTAAFVVGRPILLVMIIGSCRAGVVAGTRCVLPIASILMCVALANKWSAVFVQGILPGEAITIYWAGPTIAAASGAALGVWPAVLIFLTKKCLCDHRSSKFQRI